MLRGGLHRGWGCNACDLFWYELWSAYADNDSIGAYYLEGGRKDVHVRSCTPLREIGNRLVLRAFRMKAIQASGM